MPHETPMISDAIQETRMARHIETFSHLSEPGPGVTRLAYTALEREAHRVFTTEMSELGLSVHTDAAGNTTAELTPTDIRSRSKAAIGTGSHLDSVPEGGRFDGIAGVVAALEIARVVVEKKIPHRRPWRFVAFAAEEGARFGQACNGSRIVAGLTSEPDTHTLVDADGVTMAEAMTTVGLDPTHLAQTRWCPEEWYAFIELHIEQGSVLETSGTPVGIVEVISGSTRLLVTIKGEASHTGGTPMHLRRDALVTASRCVLACDQLARDPHRQSTRITVGTLKVHPGSITTIPGKVTFSIDLRDIDNERQRCTTNELIAEITQIANRANTPAEISLLGDTPPAVLSAWVTSTAAAAARESAIDYRVLPSGASHDSQQINHITPTGMIFVPSHNGVSHAPEEFTGSHELVVGTRVLLATLMKLDADDEH